jgi:hypothetical protein
MAAAFHLLQQIYEIHELYYAVRSAERDKVALLRQKALNLFSVCNSIFVDVAYFISF